MIQDTNNKIEWKKTVLQGVKLFFIFVILLGIIYPLSITLIAHVVLKDQAKGSFVKRNGKIVGSYRIAQKFSSDKYFASRPSQIDYDASRSGGSNLGPTSAKLQTLTKTNVENAKEKYNIKKSETLPSDMVSASSSGLDPNISLENAYLQADSVAKARSLSKEKIVKLIKENTDQDFIGIWGQESVNVLRLNIALDSLEKQ